MLPLGDKALIGLRIGQEQRLVFAHRPADDALTYLVFQAGPRQPFKVPPAAQGQNMPHVIHHIDGAAIGAGRARRLARQVVQHVLQIQRGDGPSGFQERRHFAHAALHRLILLFAFAHGFRSAGLNHLQFGGQIVKLVGQKFQLVAGLHTRNARVELARRQLRRALSQGVNRLHHSA